MTAKIRNTIPFAIKPNNSKGDFIQGRFSFSHNGSLLFCLDREAASARGRRSRRDHAAAILEVKKNLPTVSGYSHGKEGMTMKIWYAQVIGEDCSRCFDSAEDMMAFVAETTDRGKDVEVWMTGYEPDEGEEDEA